MQRHGRAVLVPLAPIVLAFMVLSLAITATGTARFAVAMGYPAEVGYAIGAVFDLAKALLPVALLMLLARRAVVLFAIIGVAWLGLVTYSSLATHATVSSAIAAIERNGTWKMEVRSDTKAELAEIEKRLAVLSQPMPPRPSKTLGEALASEVVPPGVWRDSRECQNIHDSRYFQSTCQKFLDLRRELAVAQDYEKLDARAEELRHALAAAPPVATSDPLPQAFAATLGRFLSLDGHAGIALLLTLIVETMSCFGLAGLRALKGETGRPYEPPSSLRSRGGHGPKTPTEARAVGTSRIRTQILPASSLKAARPGTSLDREGAPNRRARPPSEVLPARVASGQMIRTREELGLATARSAMGSHVSEFIQERLKPADGASVGAGELKEVYDAWCASHGNEPIAAEAGYRTHRTRYRALEVLWIDSVSERAARSVSVPPHPAITSYLRPNRPNRSKFPVPPNSRVSAARAWGRSGRLGREDLRYMPTRNHPIRGARYESPRGADPQSFSAS